ncbi:MAG: hypothetical protein V9E82_15875 [Candidatus Nanopelagicales bacterium]
MIVTSVLVEQEERVALASILLALMPFGLKDAVEGGYRSLIWSRFHEPKGVGVELPFLNGTEEQTVFAFDSELHDVVYDRDSLIRVDLVPLPLARV